MKKLLFLSLAILFAAPLLAFPGKRLRTGYDEWCNPALVGALSWSQGRYGSLEPSIGFGRFCEEKKLGLVHQIVAGYYGVEFNFNSERVIGHKLSFVYAGLMGNGGISLINYRNNGKGAMYLRPQLGIDISSYFSLSYGYNISLQRNSVVKGNVNTHLLMITGRLPYTF